MNHKTKKIIKQPGADGESVGYSLKSLMYRNLIHHQLYFSTIFSISDRKEFNLQFNF